MPVLMHGNKTMGKGKERYRISFVHTAKGLLYKKRIDRLPNPLG